MSLRDMQKEVRNLVISTPLLRPEAHQLRISLKPSPSRTGDAKYNHGPVFLSLKVLPSLFIQIFTDRLTPALPAPLPI